MKELLENQFSLMYDPSRKRHTVQEDVLIGDRSLRDEQSCGQCKPFFTQTCEHETFLIHADSSVRLLAIEGFLNSFPKIEGERCDVLLFDENKIVLLDMYCGMSDYLDSHRVEGKEVIGKKAKVRQQIEATLNRFYTVEDIAVYLDAIPEKFGVFAYRAKDEELFTNVPKTVARSMNQFLGISKAQTKRRLAAPMSHGFRYVMQAYPNRYQW